MWTHYLLEDYVPGYCWIIFELITKSSNSYFHRDVFQVITNSLMWNEKFPSILTIATIIRCVVRRQICWLMGNMCTILSFVHATLAWMVFNHQYVQIRYWKNCFSPSSMHYFPLVCRAAAWKIGCCFGLPDTCFSTSLRACKYTGRYTGRYCCRTNGPSALFFAVSEITPFYFFIKCIRNVNSLNTILHSLVETAIRPIQQYIVHYIVSHFSIDSDKQKHC